ncbi:MAG: hypothetical protein IKT50_03335 [Clostridia bacterium]|nr:hypothetical protein [Clostridia bacterium]
MEKSAKEMVREAKVYFPEASFTLYIYTDKYSVPTKISVECSDGIGGKIADFLEVKYSIPAEEYKQGESGNGTDQQNE